MDALETKAGLGRDMDELMQAFEAFKDTNDRRLAEIERRGADDAVTAEKLDRIEQDDGCADSQAGPPAARANGDAALRRGPRTQVGVRGLRPQGRDRRTCTLSKKRRCRSAPIPTAATSCRRRPERAVNTRA